jgi:hypothetical protein
VSGEVWLQDWKRKRVRRRFDLGVGRCLESKQAASDSEGTLFGVCSHCASGFALVYRTEAGIWFQVGSARVQMDGRRALFAHERRLCGLLSELRIEPKDGSFPTIVVRDLSLSRVASPLLDPTFDQIDAEEEDFLLWVANSANDVTWVAWISQRWQPVEASAG